MITTGFSLAPETIERLTRVISLSTVNKSAFVDAVLVEALDKIESGSCSLAQWMHP
jgi:hypothetical protein